MRRCELAQDQRARRVRWRNLFPKLYGIVASWAASLKKPTGYGTPRSVGSIKATHRCSFETELHSKRKKIVCGRGTSSKIALLVGFFKDAAQAPPRIIQNDTFVDRRSYTARM